jgi:hypothetical protein
MSVVGHLGGNIRNEDVRRAAEMVEVVKKVREEGTALPGGLKRVGDVGEFYDRVEDYDPVLRWHCRL